MTDWYKLNIPDASREMGVDITHGLDDAEIQRRLEQHGPNELVERGAVSPWVILAGQFKETMVVVLIMAAIISAALGEFTDAGAVMVVVLLNALLGFRQEYQAEKAMAALKKLAVPTVRVRRNGHVHEISARNLVPGDVILLEAGNMVPADARLIETANLRVQEAALTGESEPVSKDANFVGSGSLSLGDRHNMVYMGT
ncbi:MAG: ATPase, partial [Chloroflexota bacterium]